MPTVQQHLEHATANLHAALFDLECALSHAKARNYGQNWIEAIDKALTDTHAAHLHTGNIPGCLATRSDPPL